MSNLGAEVPVVGKSSKQERLHFWQNAIKEQKTSGKTIKEYCQYHHLDFDTFRRWQYRLNCKSKNLKAKQNQTKTLHKPPHNSNTNYTQTAQRKTKRTLFLFYWFTKKNSYFYLPKL